MSTIEPVKRRKGGRPQKTVKRNEYIGVKCTLYEKKAIAIQAKTAGLRPSEYLRTAGLNLKIDRQKTMPKEALEMKARLNGLAANMNQVAHKRNSNDELTEIDRTLLKTLIEGVQQLVQTMTSYFQ